jgi:ComEC/Rec2-related protein
MPAGSASPTAPSWPGLWACLACIAGVWLARYTGELAWWPHPLWFLLAAIIVVLIAAVRSQRTPAAPASFRVPRLLLAITLAFIAHAAALFRFHHPPAHWLPSVLAISADDAPTSTDRLLMVRGVVIEHAPTASAAITPRDPADIHAPQRLIVGPGFLAARRAPASLRIELLAVQIDGQWLPASGQLDVFTQQRIITQRPPLGSTIELTGQYRPPRFATRMPTSLDTSFTGSLPLGDLHFRAVHDRLAGSLSIDALSGPQSTLTIVSPDPAWFRHPAIWLQHLQNRTQQHLAHQLQSATSDATPSPSSAALLTSMMLGQDDATLSPPVEADLARLGMAHVLSVSGFHLVIITACVVWVARALTSSHRAIAIISISAIILYTLLVPLESPVIRSACQAVVVVLANTQQRRYEPLNLLGYIAATMLLIWPRELWSAGFQLSFLVTGGLLAFGPAWIRFIDALLRLGPPGVRGRIRPQKQAFTTEFLQGLRKSLAAIIATTLLAQTLSAAIVIHHTGTLPLGGLLLGIIATPLTTLALILGFAGLVISILLPAVGIWLLHLAGLICHGVLDIAQLTRAASFLWADLPMTPAWLALLGTLGIITLIAARLTSMRITAIAGITLYLLLLGLGLLTAGSQPSSITARIERYALTQQSPAILLHTRASQVLIDPGTGLGFSIAEPATRQAFQLRRAIQSGDRWRVPICIITGAEPWRFDLLPELITPLGITQVYITPETAAIAREQPGSPASRLLTLLNRKGIQVTTLDPSLTLALSTAEALTITPGTLRLELSQGALELDRSPQISTTSRWTLSANANSISHHAWTRRGWQITTTAPSLTRWYPAISPASSTSP